MKDETGTSWGRLVAHNDQGGKQGVTGEVCGRGGEKTPWVRMLAVQACGPQLDP